MSSDSNRTGMFLGNIILGHVMDLYDGDVKHDLDIMRQIRNAFAHSPSPVTLRLQPVKKELQKLRFRKYADQDLLNTEFTDVPDHKKDFFACYAAIAVRPSPGAPTS